MEELKQPPNMFSQQPILIQEYMSEDSVRNNLFLNQKQIKRKVYETSQEENPCEPDRMFIDIVDDILKTYSSLVEEFKEKDKDIRVQLREESSSNPRETSECSSSSTSRCTPRRLAVSLQKTIRRPVWTQVPTCTIKESPD